jgi:hypothetical protein
MKRPKKLLPRAPRVVPAGGAHRPLKGKGAYDRQKVKQSVKRGAA